MNLQTAIMCAEASAAVYLEWDRCKEIMNEWTNDRYTTKEFDVDGAQAFAFKLDKNTAVISFRGTEAVENDIVADLKFWKTDSRVDGRVHQGFKDELDKVEPEVMKWIRSRAVSKDSSLVYVTGHSLGAAMATLFAARLTDAGYKVILYTYGSPRCGNFEWAKTFEGVEIYRFVNTNDVVTKIPPAGLFTHVGQTMYLGYDGKLKTPVSWWDHFKDNIKARLKAWKKKQAFSGLYDHSIDNYIKKLKSNI